jgi:hypothetical protein
MGFNPITECRNALSTHGRQLIDGACAWFRLAAAVLSRDHDRANLALDGLIVWRERKL